MYIESVLQEELKLNLLLRAVRFDEPPHLRKTSSTNTTMSGNRKYSNLNEDERSQTLNRKNLKTKETKSRESLLREKLIEEFNQYNNQYSDDYISSLIVQPPPKENDLSEELIDKLIIPKPSNLFDSLDNELEKSLSQQTILTHLNSNNLADDLMDKMEKTIQQVKELSQHDDLYDQEMNRDLKSTDTIEELGRSSVLKLMDEELNEELNEELVELEEQIINKTNEIKRNHISKTTSCLEMSLLNGQKDDDWLNSLANIRGSKKYSLTESEKVGKLIDLKNYFTL